MGEVERGLPFGRTPRAGEWGPLFPRPPGAGPLYPRSRLPWDPRAGWLWRADPGAARPPAWERVGAAGAGGGARGGRRCPCGAAGGARVCTPGGRRGHSVSEVWSAGRAHHVVPGSAQVRRRGRVAQRRRVTAPRAQGPPACVPAPARRVPGTLEAPGSRRSGGRWCLRAGVR